MIEDAPAPRHVPAGTARPLEVTLAGFVEATAVVDGHCTMLLDSPTLSRPVELRYESALAATVLSLLCRDVVVQGRLNVDEDMSTYSVEVMTIQLESPALPAREDAAPHRLPDPETPSLGHAQPPGGELGEVPIELPPMNRRN